MQDTGPGNGKNAGWCETWAFGSVADAWTVPGALARLADTWTAPGALARLADTWTGAWGSGSLGGHLDRRLGLWLGLPRKSSCVFLFRRNFF